MRSAARSIQLAFSRAVLRRDPISLQKHLPAAMFDFQSDRGYQAEIEALMLKLVRGKSVAKGDVDTPWQSLCVGLPAGASDQ